MTTSAPDTPPAEAQVPPEAKQAAVEELERLAQAESYSPSPGQPYDSRIGARYVVPDPSPRRGYAMPGGHDDGPMAPPPGRPQSLEDLYAMYPKIGDGQFKLRVTRTFPKNYRGMLTEGFLEDLDEKVALAEFEDKFGGGVYKVTVIGPGRKTDESGAPLIQTLGAAVELKIPGPPASTSLPKAKEEEMYSMMGMAGGNRVMPFGVPHEPESVQLERIKQQEREQKRRDDERIQLLQIGSRGEPGISPEYAKTQASEMRQLYDSHSKTLENQNNKLIEAMNIKEAENRELRSKLTEAEGKAARVTSLESDLAMTRTRLETENKDLRDRFERETKDTNERHRMELARVNEEAKKDIERINEAHRTELTRETNRYTEERQRQNEMHSEKMSSYKDDANRRCDDLKDQLTREITSLKDAHARELQTLKDAQASELRAITKIAEGETKVTTTQSETRIEALKERIAILDSDNRHLRDELQDLRAKTNKDPKTLLLETKQMAEDLLGMTDKQPEEKDTPFDVKKEIAGAVRSLIDKAPEALRELGNMRSSAQQQMQEQQAAMAQQQAMMQQQQMQQGRLPAAARQAQRQWTPAAGSPPGFGQPMPGQPVGASPYPGYQGPVVGVPAPPPPLSFQYAVPAPDQADGSAARQAAAAAPPPPMAPMPPMPPQAQQPPPPQQQQGQPQQQAQPQQAQQGSALTDEQVIMFLEALASAVPPNGVIPAAAFARGFIERAGPDNTRALLQSVPPERIFEFIEERDHKPWRVIVTRDGQRYTREVWAAAAAEVGG